MKIYHSPKIEIEELCTEDIVLASPTTGGSGMGGGDHELPVMPRSTGGSIAGGSTVSRITGSSSSNAFSVGDIFGNK